MNRITNVTWTKNEMPIQAGLKDQVDFGFDGSISIANVQKRHSGLYRYLIKIVKLVRLKNFILLTFFFPDAQFRLKWIMQQPPFQ